jgi:WD40 repeat protein
MAEWDNFANGGPQLGGVMRTMAVLAAVSVLIGTAQGEELPAPGGILRIEPGMHTAQLTRISVDAACTLMVTGSLDKTARVWALPAGGQGSPTLLRTLRVPIGEGDEGKIYAVALSPDGKWVAAGGWDAHYAVDKTLGVYIFEAGTGRLAARLGPLRNVINHLTFSPDGSRLAATLFGGEGMRLWETAGWRLIAEDKDYGGKGSFDAAFDGANRLYTVAFDGAIRRYAADGKLEIKASALGGGTPFSVAVHPKGGKLAIGFSDTVAVDVYDAHTLEWLYAADTGGIADGDLSKAAWSADGSRLYAGGRYSPTDGRRLAIWQNEGQGSRAQVPLSQNTVMQLMPCGDGMAAGAQDPAFGLIAADGAKRVWQEGVSAGMRDKLGGALTLSADGKTVRFGLGPGAGQPVLFDVAAFRLADAPQAVTALSAAKVSGLALTGWENGQFPKLNGKFLPLENYEESLSLAIAPDGSRFTLGTTFWLRTFAADGREIWQKPVPGGARGLNIGGNAKLLVAAFEDGTVRWYRFSDGEELLALFVHARDRRYVAWTPKGYYAASPGAEDLIGWHINRGWDRAPDFFPASRFREHFNRPDIVARVLDDLDEDVAISEANRVAGSKQAGEIAKQFTPALTVMAPG